MSIESRAPSTLSCSKRAASQPKIENLRNLGLECPLPGIKPLAGRGTQRAAEHVRTSRSIQGDDPWLKIRQIATLPSKTPKAGGRRESTEWTGCAGSRNKACT